MLPDGPRATQIRRYSRCEGESPLALNGTLFVLVNGAKLGFYSFLSDTNVAFDLVANFVNGFFSPLKKWRGVAVFSVTVTFDFPQSCVTESALIQLVNVEFLQKEKKLETVAIKQL